MNGIHQYQILIYITAGLSLFTLFMFVYNKKSILTGFLFNHLIIVALIDLVILTTQSSNRFLNIIGAILMIGIVIIIVFGALFFIVGLFWNARIVRKYESRSFANQLTLLIGIGLIVLFFLFPILRQYIPQEWWFVDVLSAMLYFTFFYFLWMFINFCTTVLLYQLHIPRKNKDYLIVLGSGLSDGKNVTPLLASRIEGAIQFYEKQTRKKRPCKIIFSGGQGPNEEISEAEAMRNYAVSSGIPIEDCILEDKSQTTKENIRYSLNIIKRQQRKYKALVFSNNFHIVRAIHIANSEGLNAQGVGTPTALYFLPNAIIREFIGMVVLKPKLHLILLILSYVVILSLGILSAVN